MFLWTVRPRLHRQQNTAFGVQLVRLDPVAQTAIPAVTQGFQLFGQLLKLRRVCLLRRLDQHPTGALEVSVPKQLGQVSYGCGVSHVMELVVQLPGLVQAPQKGAGGFGVFLIRVVRSFRRGLCRLLRHGLRVDAALLADFREVLFDFRNQAGSGFVDRFQAGPQLLQLLALGPGGNIPEAVVPGLDAEILADRVGDAFGLDFFGVAVLLDWLRISRCGADFFRLLLLIVVQLGVGDLMHQGGDGLHLTHALADGDGLICKTEIAVRIRGDRREGDRNRRGSPQRLHEHVVLLHASGKGRRELREGLAVRLRHVEHLDRLEHGDADLPFLHDLLSVLVQHRRVGVGVELDFLDLFLEGRRSDDRDAALALLHMASELVFPLLEARHEGGVRALEIDEHGVVHAVSVEPAQDGEILPVAVRLEQLLDALLDAVRDLPQSLFICFGSRVGFGFCHDKFELLPFETKKALPHRLRYPCRSAAEI